MINKVYQLQTLTCPNCVAKIQTMLKRTAGVNEAEVLFNSSRVKVSFDESLLSSEEIVSRITKLGFKVLSEK